jgi:hypothetical protein
MGNETISRMLIVTTAMAEANAGAHYLKGADGGVPDGAAGLTRTPRLLEDLSIDNLGVHAAKSDFGVCRGRWEMLTDQGGKQFAKGQYDRDTLLPAYLDELYMSMLPSSQWKSFNYTGLYPRRSSGYLYLGEDCRNHRHFDCEGFVAWVLVKAAGKDAGTWRKGVSWYQNGGGGRLDVYKAVGDAYVRADGAKITKNDILDGDILIRKPNQYGGEHIAFACAKGSAVIEASGKDRGVLRSAYKPNWTDLARIKSW